MVQTQSQTYSFFESVERWKYLADPADKYPEMIKRLDDLRDLYTHPELVEHRDLLLRTTRSEDKVRVVELYGIAKAVSAHFSTLPQYKTCTDEAESLSRVLEVKSYGWLERHVASASTVPTTLDSKDDHSTFREEILLKWLDWVHADHVAVTGAPGASPDSEATSCLCPMTAYLQCLLRHSPVQDWVAAALTQDTSSSQDTNPAGPPLAFILALARKWPGIGRQTADVVMLVTMGCHAVRIKKKEMEKVKEAEKAADPSFGNDPLKATKNHLARTALKWLHASSPSDFERHRLATSSEQEDMLTYLTEAARTLKESGQHYAQLLREEGDHIDELNSLASTIRSVTGFILARADLPCPTELLIKAVNCLALKDA